MRIDVPTTSGPTEVAAATAAGEDRCEPLPAERAPPVLDDWELDELLRQIARLLATEREAPPSRKRSRLDAAHRSSRRPRRSGWGTKLRRIGERIETEHARRILPILVWVATLLGTMAVVCGGVLVAWSMVTGRQELWRIGMPAALGGGTSLALGILLQLDRLWQRKRAAASPARKEPAGGPPSLDLAIDPAHPALAGELALSDLSTADSPLPAEPGSFQVPSRPAGAGDLP